MANEYFPSLNTIVQLSDLPERLNFLQNAINSGINSTLDDLYFRNYQVSESEEGDLTSYELDLIIYKKLDLDFCGTGLTLSLDTSTNFNQTNFSLIPISLTFQHEIRRYIKNIENLKIPTKPQDFYDLIFDVLGIDDKELLLSTIYTLITDSNPFQVFIDNAKSKRNLLIKANFSSDETVLADEILEALNYCKIDLQELVFEDYIFANSIDNTLQNINKLLIPHVGVDALDTILDLFIPKISARLVLNNAGLLLPRTVLIPLDANGNKIDAPARTALNFGQFELNYSTEGGIGFESDVSFTLNPFNRGFHPRLSIFYPCGVSKY